MSAQYFAHVPHTSFGGYDLSSFVHDWCCCLIDGSDSLFGVTVCVCTHQWTAYYHSLLLFIYRYTYVYVCMYMVVCGTHPLFDRMRVEGKGRRKSGSEERKKELRECGVWSVYGGVGTRKLESKQVVKDLRNWNFLFVGSWVSWHNSVMIHVCMDISTKVYITMRCSVVLSPFLSSW